MSTLNVKTIRNEAGTGAPDFPNGIRIPATNALPDPENRIINGAFDFWQRGTSGTGAGYVAADRWANITSGSGTVTQSRQAFTLGDTLGSNSPTYFLRQTVSGQSGVGAYAFTIQRIEGVRSYAGQTITVLGWARRSSGAGNMTVEAEQGFGAGGSPSTFVAAISPTTVNLTGSFAPFAVVMTIPSIIGKTLGTDGGDYTGICFWTSGGSDYNARTNSLGIQTIGVDLWGVHIKLGTHTTDAVNFYKAPELGPELARCQRYYQRYGNASFRVSAATGGLDMRVSHNYTTAMRATASVSLFGGSSVNVSTAEALGGNPNQFILRVISGAAGLSGFIDTTLIADAEL